MDRCALIYEAELVQTQGDLFASGLMYGVVDGQVLDGETKCTYYIQKAWIEDCGISVIDSQGHEYLILSLDYEITITANNFHHLLALAFLSSERESKDEN